jgi:hypothetical protein
VLTEALALAEQRQDSAAIGEATTYLGHATVVAGDRPPGRRLLQEAVRSWVALGYPHRLGETPSISAMPLMSWAACRPRRRTIPPLWSGLRMRATHSTRGSSTAISASSSRVEGTCLAQWAQIQALVQTSASLRDRWFLSFAAQATVALVGSRPQSRGPNAGIGAPIHRSALTGSVPTPRCRVSTFLPTNQTARPMSRSRKEKEKDPLYGPRP